MYRDAKKEGRELGTIEEYLAKTNDATMKVIEASNLGYDRSINPTRGFARELEFKNDPALNIFHYEISDLLQEIPALSQEVQLLLEPYRESSFFAQNAAKSLTAAWDYDSYDHYHSEERCTGTGEDRSCTTVQVYDYTDHDYDYYPEDGMLAAAYLNQFVEQTDKPFVPEKIHIASRIGEDNRAAIESTIGIRREGTYYIDQEEIRKYMSLFRNGSTLIINTPTIQALYEQLTSDEQIWKKDHKTAQSTSYRTYSKFDSGPSEYQSAQQIRGHAKDYRNQVKEIYDGLQQAQHLAPKLDSLITEFISVELDGKKGNSGRLRKEILDTTQEIYNTNFIGGVDISGLRGWMIGLFSVGGMAMGAGLGTGADYLIGTGRRRRR